MSYSFKRIEVLRLREDVAAGMSYQDAAEKYRTNSETVGKIYRGERYPSWPGPTTKQPELKPEPKLTCDQRSEIMLRARERQAAGTLPRPKGFTKDQIEWAWTALGSPEAALILGMLGELPGFPRDKGCEGKAT